MMTLEQAVKRVEENHARAEKLSYVQDKTAWALYQTWKEAELMRQARQWKKEALMRQEQQSVDEKAEASRKPKFSEEWTRQ